MKIPAKFRLIYADPPWRFDNRANRGSPDYNLGGSAKRAKSAYSTMTLDDICDMPVSSVCEPDALLALWAPWAMVLGDGKGISPAMRVCEAWGFEPKTAIPWVKGRWDGDNLKLHIGLGNYIRVASEVLILARLGKFRIPPSDRLPGILSPRTRHSAKPEVTRDFLETLVNGPYAELFARSARPGWDLWGNQAPAPSEYLSSVLGGF